MNFIFLTYVNRSGSTYLANLLDSSPRILACPEGEMLVSVFLENPNGKFKFDEQANNRLTKIFSADPKLQYWGDGKSFFPGLEKAKNNLEAFVTILINYKNQVKPNAEFILFKAERIVFLLGKIQKVSSIHNISFISIVRDPRAVYASQKRTLIPETQKLMSKKPVKTALFWKGHTKKCIKESNQGNQTILSYEDLILDYKQTIKKISVLSGVKLSEFTSEEGSLFKRIPEDYKSIHINCEEPPDSSKINEWENFLNKSEILKIELISGKILTKLGYKKKNKKFQYLTIIPIVIPEMAYYYFRKMFQKILFKLRLI